MAKKGHLETFLSNAEAFGYFSLQLDTIRSDTIQVCLGPRSMVDTILIVSAPLVVLDSIATLSFPFAYEAKKIQAYAQKTLTYFAEHGHPFATLSIQIDEAEHSTDSLTNQEREGPQRFTVSFLVDAHRPAVFSDPLFTGDYTIRQSVLYKDILFKPGTPFSSAKVDISRLRLQSRPYIQTVEAPIITVVPESDTLFVDSSLSHLNRDSVDIVNVQYALTENSGLGIDGVLGYQTNSDSPWSGILHLTMLNIFRFGESLTLNYHGEELFSQFSFALDLPFLFGLPIMTELSFGLEINEGEKENNDDDFGYLHGGLEVLTQLKGLWQAGGAVRGYETIVKNRTDYFIGFDLILKRTAEEFMSGAFSRELYLKTGTGIADRAEGRFSRWRFDFIAGMHYPLFKQQALVGRFVTNTVTLNKRDSLQEVEQNRVGGHRSIRGYAENQFPFTNVSYVQSEYHFYYNRKGSLYIFMDGGIGFAGPIRLSAETREELFGYGAGIAVPIRQGILSLEWARNYQEDRGPGRLHLRIRNRLSARN